MEPGAVVVAAALWVEARTLRSGAPAIRVLRTGMGPAHARRAAERLRIDPARHLAIAGLCGAADPELQPGDVLVASELRRVGASNIVLETERMERALACLGVRSKTGVLHSSEGFVRGARRGELFCEGVAAVDMESAWLAEAAAGRPLAVLRVVVDTAQRELLRPSMLRDGFHALRVLRTVAPALQIWATGVMDADAFRRRRALEAPWVGGTLDVAPSALQQQCVAAARPKPFTG
jgi:4-hydroxy-3-methylbut-2-enyl diphosphate reductase